MFFIHRKLLLFFFSHLPSLSVFCVCVDDFVVAKKMATTRTTMPHVHCHGGRRQLWQLVLFVSCWRFLRTYDLVNHMKGRLVLTFAAIHILFSAAAIRYLSSTLATMDWWSPRWKEGTPSSSSGAKKMDDPAPCTADCAALRRENESLRAEVARLRAAAAAATPSATSGGGTAAPSAASAVTDQVSLDADDLPLSLSSLGRSFFQPRSS